jgi:hypothetical protein
MQLLFYRPKDNQKPLSCLIFTSFGKTQQRKMVFDLQNQKLAYLYAG